MPYLIVFTIIIIIVKYKKTENNIVAGPKIIIQECIINKDRTFTEAC